MGNIKFIIYLISVLLVSLFIVISKPQVEKQAVITDSEHKIAEVSIPAAPLAANNQGVTVTSVPQSVQKNVVTPITPSKKQVKQPQQLYKPKTSIQQPLKNQNSNKNTTQNTIGQKQNISSKPTKTAKTIELKPTQNIDNQKTTHVLTEQEEIIAWNIWRSRLQNQVMMDSKLAAPLGTQFKFSFTVDKYGNMSNVKVWSTSPGYSDYAVRTIKPVLMSYRNKPILNFPEGTKRIIVNVDGGFFMSTSTRYSSPGDYHDYEKVKR